MSARRREPVRQAGRPVRDHRLLGRRQVGGDRRLRGLRLLLRRQPAAADDRVARRALPPRGQRRAPRGGRHRRPRRRLLRRPDRGPRRAARRAASSRRVLFLEADEETLVDRFKETRRRHPLAPDGRVVDGIRAEREILGPLRERADVVMDTSDLTGAMLRRRIATDLLGPRSQREARADDPHLRVQERPAARRRPDLRRPLPAQPALPRGPAPADRPRSAGRRARRGRRPGERVLRAPAAAARLPAARLRRRGQDPPDDRDRLHRRAPPLGDDRRPRRPAPRRPRRPRAARRAPRRRARLSSSALAPAVGRPP